LVVLHRYSEGSNDGSSGHPSAVLQFFKQLGRVDKVDSQSV